MHKLFPTKARGCNIKKIVFILPPCGYLHQAFFRINIFLEKCLVFFLPLLVFRFSFRTFTKLKEPPMLAVRADVFAVLQSPTSIWSHTLIILGHPMR